MNRSAVVAVTVALFSGGCGGREPGEGPATDPADTIPWDTVRGARSRGDPPSGPATRPERPPTRTDTIYLEGTPEVTELTLVRSPSGFEPAFSTYVPEGMVRVFGHPVRGLELRFVAAFGGVRNEEASLGFTFHPPETTEDEVREEARRVAREHGGSGEPLSPGRWEWAEAEYPFGDAGGPARLFGTVAVASHGGRWFRVLLRYPPEYGDGFAPRTELILDAWRWEESGEGLGGGG